MLFTEDRDGFFCWPRTSVALVREDALGRLAAHSAQGELGHCPGPLERVAGPPLVRVGRWLVNPALVRVEEGELVVPGGWRFPFEGELPPAEAVPERAPEELPGGVSSDEVVLLSGRDGAAWWLAADGRWVRAGASAAAVARGRPWLVKAGRGTYVVRDRLRRILRERKRFVLWLDPGVEVSVSWGARGALCRGLGLPHLLYLEPREARWEFLSREGLQDWPQELFRASPEFLRGAFSEPRKLLANLVWQTFRLRSSGRDPDYGRDHRSFWYIPAWPVLKRAGLLGEESAVGALDPRVFFEESLEELLRRTMEPYQLLELVLALLVGEYRLCTYAELGFEDPRPDLREVGSVRPGIVVVAEKTSLRSGVSRLAAQFGVSTLILGGLPSLLSTEFFVQALRASWSGPVRLAALVDFDPSGWIAAEGLAGQLERYGVPVEEVRFLVRPERFTAEEVALYRRRLRGSTPQRRGKIRAWVERSGGIGGEAFGLHADHLRPTDRVVAAFREELLG